ncbi:MAG: MBL fold metallo-hydrolase [Actinomycetes bacterium]
MKFPLSHPDLEPYQQYFQEPKSSASSGLTVTFLGVSTLLLDDGQTAIMTDGFFSRPGKFAVIGGKIAPDRAVVAAALQRADVTKLAAVVCAHSHYDHALDSPVVAELSGAVVVGSESTANICRGADLPADQIHVATAGLPMQFGDFKVTLVESLHTPKAHYPGKIEQPVVPPAKASTWAMGEVYSVIIEHRGRTLVLQASTNFVPEALDGFKADVVYLGIATLGRQTPQFFQDYWDEVVVAVGARTVIPVHWDDFFVSLDRPLRPFQYVADNFDVSMRLLLDRAGRDGVRLELPVAWQQTDPFS